jgi:hypothetical protein
MAVYREITCDQAVLTHAETAPAEIARVLRDARERSPHGLEHGVGDNCGSSPRSFIGSSYQTDKLQLWLINPGHGSYLSPANTPGGAFFRRGNRTGVVFGREGCLRRRLDSFTPHQCADYFANAGYVLLNRKRL